MPELGPFWDAVAKLGIALVLGLALWYFILTPRKLHDGSRKSAFLVPGWVHDTALAEPDRVRDLYEKLLKDAHNASNIRIQELRVFRDEERAARIDAETDSKALLTAINELASSVDLLLEISKVAPGDGRSATKGR